MSVRPRRTWNEESECVPCYNGYRYLCVNISLIDLARVSGSWTSPLNVQLQSRTEMHSEWRRQKKVKSRRDRRKGHRYESDRGRSTSGDFFSMFVRSVRPGATAGDGYADGNFFPRFRTRLDDRICLKTKKKFVFDVFKKKPRPSSPAIARCYYLRTASFLM